MTCGLPSFAALNLSLAGSQHRHAPLIEAHPLQERFDE